MAYFLYDGKNWNKVGNKFANEEALIDECRADGIFRTFAGMIEEYNAKDCYMFFDRSIQKFKKEKILKLYSDKDMAHETYILSVPGVEMDEEMRKEIEREKETDAFFSGANESVPTVEKKTETEQSSEESSESSEEKSESSSEEPAPKRKRGRPKKNKATVSLL